jgi:hypothetical protein
MGSSQSATSGSTTTSIDPQLKANYLSNYTQAQNLNKDITATGPWNGATDPNNPYFAQPTWAYSAAGQPLQSLYNGMATTYDPQVPGLLSNDAASYAETVAATPYKTISGSGYDPSGYQATPASMKAASANPNVVDRSAVRDINPWGPVNDGSVRDVSFLSGPNYMAPYTNAYTDQVVNQGLTDLDRARQMSIQDNSATAIKNGAFGGDRAAIMDAETNRNFADAAARMSTTARDQGFNTALQASQTDLARRAAAEQANQGADVSMAGLKQNSWLDAQKSNQGMDLQTALANLSALNQGGQFNAQLSQDAAKTNTAAAQQAELANQGVMTGAQQFNATQQQAADVANQQAGFQRNSQLMQDAQLSQTMANQQMQMPIQLAQALTGYDTYGRQLSQDQINAAIQQWQALQFKGVPGFQVQSGALGLSLPNLGGTTSGNSTTTYSPSPLSTIGSLAGIGSLFF